jgi:hypothetical protein
LEVDMNALDSNRHWRFLAAGLFALALLVPSCGAPASGEHDGTPLKQDLALREDMRKLWEDHIMWTRLVIVSTVAGLPDLDATTQRLLQNQTDIGNEIKPYYGDEAGTRLTALLREHIIGAANILAAAKGKDAVKLEAGKKAWYANADTIAAFLAAANPKAWAVSDMQTMMRKHLDLTLAEAVDQLQGNYAVSVADYDKVHDEILAMADMLSNGIIQQFPKKV